MTTDAGRRVQLFYNVTAGGYCPTKLSRLRSSLEANGAEVLLSECGPGKEVVIDDPVTHVCAVGGDGTARFVALALARNGQGLPLSIFPGGTVNLAHREIGSPTDPDRHAMHVLGGGDARLYSAEINDSLFLVCASAGPDSRAVAGVSGALKRRIGKLAYLVAFLPLLVRWPRESIVIECDGRRAECEAFYVAKGRFFAGPWSFAPGARLGDPLLHVVALKSVTRRAWLRFVWMVLRGKDVTTLPDVSVFTCTRFTAQGATPVPVQADGDIVAALPVDVRVCAEPIRLC